MRLTLRALLNWINQNLSESDSLLIAQKVEESELAKALKAQIENVMQIPDLQAPNVLDGTPLGNANSTAEYLDNSMQPEKTLDYEKFCIRSDVVLGETASCHFILSRVLSEAPTPSPQLRDRLLSLYQYIGTDDEFSLPLKSAPTPTGTTEKLFSEIPFHLVDDASEGADLNNGKNTGNTPDKNEGVHWNSVSPDQETNAFEKPNYWKYSTLALCAIFLVWLATGLLFSNSIPGRMLRAAFESPTNQTTQAAQSTPADASSAEENASR